MERFGQIGFGGVAGVVIAAFVLVLAARVQAAVPTVEDLVGLLGGNRSPKVRAQAALNLAGLAAADDAVIDALVRGLDDEAPMVRGSCAKALGNFALIRTFRPLDQACTASGNRRRNGSWASRFHLMLQLLRPNARLGSVSFCQQLP